MPAVTKTLLAPNSLAIWIAARPTPDAPASERKKLSISIRLNREVNEEVLIKSDESVLTNQNIFSRFELCHETHILNGSEEDLLTVSSLPLSIDICHLPLVSLHPVPMKALSASGSTFSQTQQLSRHTISSQRNLIQNHQINLQCHQDLTQKHGLQS